MKKTIIALSFVFLVSPFVTQASIDKNLYYGLKNDAQVIELQEFLIDTYQPIGITPTGNFFSLTLKLVKKFQADNGLPTTGFVGTLTRAEINKKLAMGLAESEEELAKEPVATPSVIPTIPTVPTPTIPTIIPSYGSSTPESNPLIGITTPTLKQFSNKNISFVNGSLLETGIYIVLQNEDKSPYSSEGLQSSITLSNDNQVISINTPSAFVNGYQLHFLSSDIIKGTTYNYTLNFKNKDYSGIATGIWTAYR